jgi:putative copper export protein
VSRTRLELLQWFGLLAAPLAWAVQLVAGFGVADAACDGAGGVAVTPYEVTLTAVALAVALLAEAAAVVLFRELAAVEDDAPGPAGRLRFFAVAALLGNVLFFVIILLSGVGSVIHLPCTQS